MKIICVDNFNRETVNDWLVADNVNKRMGERIIEALNKQESDESPTYFRLVEDDYKLFVFEP